MIIIDNDADHHYHQMSKYEITQKMKNINKNMKDMIRNQGKSFIFPSFIIIIDLKISIIFISN